MSSQRCFCAALLSFFFLFSISSRKNCFSFKKLILTSDEVRSTLSLVEIHNMPTVPLNFKPVCFLKLSDFFFWNAKTQRGLFQEFLKKAVNLSCAFLDSLCDTILTKMICVDAFFHALGFVYKCHQFPSILYWSKQWVFVYIRYTEW